MVGRRAPQKGSEQDDGTVEVRFKLGPALKALVVALASLMGLGGAGIWASRNAEEETASEMTAMTDALVTLQTDVRDLKAAFLTRAEAAEQFRALAAVSASIQADVAFTTRAIERLERRAERTTRGR